MGDRLHNTGLRTLERWRSGQPISARHANQVIDAVSELRRGVRPGRQVVRMVGGEGEAQARPSGQRMFTLNAEHDDHLTCYDPIAEVEVLVAKRRELRRRTYDGVTIGGVDYTYTSSHTRTLRRTEDNYFENHEVWPQYETEQEIFAVRLTAAEVDLEIEESVDPLESQQVVWLELDSHRDWTRVRTLGAVP